jgi:RHS repeat-associated protein
VITDAAGNIKAESDYYPWGGELQFVNNDSNHYKFTGKKRDTESGLDYFGARYYSNALGRFITPDWAAKATAVDALGNLLTVTQKGDPAVNTSSQWRVRNFTCNSLSQLLTATNPESGTITYSYAADGNLLQKTSPLANQTGSATQTVSYCYDALHRVTGKGYAGQTCPLATPVVTYT